MSSLVYALLAAILLPNLTSGDLSEQFGASFRQGVAGAGRVAVSVRRAPAGGLGCLAEVRAEVDQVDAADLPLAGLVPLARPRAPKGRIDRLVLDATNVWLEQLKASRVLFEAKDVTYDLAAARRGQVLLTGFGSQQVTVVLRDHDLDSYAAEALPELTGAQLTFEGDQLVARAEVPLIFAAFKAEIRGRLAIDGGRTVRLVDATIDLGRIEISDDLRADILARLDPLIDLEESLHFPVPLVWTEVAIRDGEARIHGRLAPPAVVDVPRTFQPRWRYLR